MVCPPPAMCGRLLLAGAACGLMSAVRAGPLWLPGLDRERQVRGLRVQHIQQQLWRDRLSQLPGGHLPGTFLSFLYRFVAPESPRVNFHHTSSSNSLSLSLSVILFCPSRCLMYQPAPRQPTCIACPAGTYWNASRYVYDNATRMNVIVPQCIPCAAGYWQASPGQVWDFSEMRLIIPMIE
jgi:hypothetical protein